MNKWVWVLCAGMTGCTPTADFSVVGDQFLSEDTQSEPNPSPTPPFELVDPEAPESKCATRAGNRDFTVTLGWAADDASTVFIDGQEIGRTTAWTTFHEKSFSLKSGCHTLAIHAKDVYNVTSGVLAYLKVDGEYVWKSGDGNEFLKAFGPQAPVGDWQKVDYDQSAWRSSETCANLSPWGSVHKRVNDLGAKWIWWSSNCGKLAQAFFRLSFTLTE